MEKQIRYSGQTAATSDYDCNDGELAISFNMLNEDGALRPMLDAVRTVKFPPDISSAGPRPFFIHKTHGAVNYLIVTDGGKLYWAQEGAVNEASEIICNAFDGTFPATVRAEAIGNTLMLFSDDRIDYLLWSDRAYTLLGNELPHVELSFGLVGHPRRYSKSDGATDTVEVTFTGCDEKYFKGELDLPVDGSADRQQEITDDIMPRLTAFVAQETVDKGRFCFPFLLRYALRLFDGSVARHSPPILMNPSTNSAPVVLWLNMNEWKYFRADFMLVAADIDWQKVTVGDYTGEILERWKDVVEGIDIYISKPLYPYDPDGKIKRIQNFSGGKWNTRFIGRLAEDDNASLMSPLSSLKFLENYAEYDYEHIWQLYFDRNTPNIKEAGIVHLPMRDSESLLKELGDEATFYKLASLSLTEIAENSSRQTLHIPDDYLKSLTARATMPDEFRSNDRLMSASHSFAYNNRLNLAGVRRQLFRGFTPQGMFAYVNAIVQISMGPGEDEMTVYAYAPTDRGSYMDVYIREDGANKKVSAKLDDYSKCLPAILPLYESNVKWRPPHNSDDLTALPDFSYHWPCYFYYPNTNAHTAVLNYAYGGRKYKLDLERHDFLNGVYAVLPYGADRSGVTTDLALPVGDDIVDVPNKVFTSEVNNPFYIPAEGINTIGAGEIRGISAATKALSQGQFGQFPLYAFTDEGVWALEVGSTGMYTAKQPVVRDVVITPESITQTEDAVLFATNRGIMVIAGSQTHCLTDDINADFHISLADFPGMSQIVSPAIALAPFRRFLSGCRMAYDYYYQRIYAFNPALDTDGNRLFPYAYVLSLKSHKWAVTPCDYTASLNSYPQALVVGRLGEIYNLSAEGGREVGTSPFIISRPFKFDAPDIHKTVNTLIQRGYFAKGHVKTILYASNDLLHWHLVASSVDHIIRGVHGSGFKYFRIACICSGITKDESLAGASVIFTPKLTNRLR